ncbi:glutaredoxin family protein [Mycobacteroides abscessus]|uniref:glutaredoxin family protein n=1 Tax=Mycobacteroides abscessus TaxID=36809 RepID=UPI0009CC6C06|nr:glutaredoxin family protein [Mycobacteroides abscessus]MDM2104792.1 glutaredoxin family protein [Mycobacteroides abscessus]MDM2133624.1 glutaredoxin family protein [Mycobacteroides abscessus]MDM2142644.1 glutaredoxin family protein [Mycobacteroides abscessus]MDM2153750.1 glutaredoxin family protein [Mycobacteroides abscessus]MDM2182783.1 glutaredoxin family protein [Mycobacteroides abscessus]
MYTSLVCHRCKAVKRKLDELNAEYQEVRADLDAEARDLLLAKGYQEVPVTRVGEEWIGGYRPDDLAAAVAALKGAP